MFREAQEFGAREHLSYYFSKLLSSLGGEVRLREVCSGIELRSSITSSGPPPDRPQVRQ